jgi:hypothetical protein
MAGPDVHGPVDVVVIEFPGDAGGDSTAGALMDLVDRGIVRLYDLMVVRKDDDGRCAEVGLRSTSGGSLGWARFAGARSGLLDDDDVQLANDVLDAGTTAALILFENTWAVPFVAAARSEGGEMVATARLTAQQIMDALDAVEMAS